MYQVLAVDPATGSRTAELYSCTFETVFEAYCVSEDEKGQGGPATMDMPEYMKFLTEMGVLGKELTNREARGIFVKVNLDDDLFVQDDADEGNSSSELVLDEFVECLVRVAMELHGFELGEASEERSQVILDALDEFMHKWLANKTFGRMKKAAKKIGMIKMLIKK